MTRTKAKKEAAQAMEFMRNNRDRVYLCAGYAWASFAAIAGHETCPAGPWDTSAPVCNPEERTCEWVEVEEGSELYNTCKDGDEFQVLEGLELWPHCHWCGGKIVAIASK